MNKPIKASDFLPQPASTSLNRLNRAERRQRQSLESQARIEHKAFELSQALLQHRLAAKGNVVAKAHDIHDAVEAKTVYSQARSHAIFRTAAEMEPGAINELVAIYQIAAMQRLSLFTAAGQVLGQEVRDLEQW